MESEIVISSPSPNDAVDAASDNPSSEICMIPEDHPVSTSTHDSTSTDTNSSPKNEGQEGIAKLKGSKREKKAVLKRVCDECGKFVEYLSRHKRRTHNFNPSELLHCFHCPLKFVNGRSLWRHYTKHHKGLNDPSSITPYNKLSVPLLNSTGSTSTTLTANALQCADCEQEFNTEMSLRRHYYFIHGQGTDPDNHLRCDQCFKSFKQKATLDDHVRRVHEGKGFFCDLCPSRGDLQSAAKLWRHKVDKHDMTDLEPPSGVNIIQCEFCGEKLFRGLKSHVRKNHPKEYIDFKNRLPTIKLKIAGETKVIEVAAAAKIDNIINLSVECPQCSKVIHSGSLRRHLKNVHGIGNVRRYPCPQCDQEFKERYHLNDHIISVHDGVQKSLDSSKLLKLKCLANGKKVFTCNLCLAKFPNKFQARTHIASEHPSEYQSLEDGIIPELYFTCSQCPEKFTKDDELRTHVSSSHPDKCWKCPKCWKVLLNPEDFTDHFKAEHMPGSAVVAKLQKQDSEDSKPSDNTATATLKEIGKMRVSCPVCSRNLAFAYVQDHNFEAHGIERKAKICPECKAVFKRLNHWANHMHTVHEFLIDKVLIESCKLDEKDVSQIRSKAKAKIGRPRATTEINELNLKSVPKSAKKSGRELKNIKVEGETDKIRPGTKLSIIKAQKSRKVGKYKNYKCSSGSDDEQDVVSGVATRKSGRTTKSKKIDWRSLVDCGSESDDDNDSKSETEYFLPPGVKLSDMKSCHVPLVRLTSSQIQENLCSVKIIKVEVS